MFVTVSYDIRDDKRRNRIAKILKDYGIRVQYSVFDCSLDERRLLELRGKLVEEMDQTDDSVRFYELCRRCRRAIEVLGQGPLLEDQDIVVL